MQKTIPYGVERCLIFGLFWESRAKSLDSLGARFHYSGSGAAVPLQIQGNRLLVEASIGKASGRFLLDTGNEFGFSG